MSSIAIAVRLKAPDPAAATALSTMKRISPEETPDLLQRYDYWEFTGIECTENTVREIVEHFDDIVNPNKQSWSFTPSGGLPADDGDHTSAGVLVTDREDSISENWTAILKRRGFPVEKVMHSVLWIFGFSREISCTRLKSIVAGQAVTSRRDAGLLANPVSQTVRLILEEQAGDLLNR